MIWKYAANAFALTFMLFKTPNTKTTAFTVNEMASVSRLSALALIIAFLNFFTLVDRTNMSTPMIAVTKIPKANCRVGESRKSCIGLFTASLHSMHRAWSGFR